MTLLSEMKPCLDYYINSDEVLYLVHQLLKESIRKGWRLIEYSPLTYRESMFNDSIELVQELTFENHVGKNRTVVFVVTDVFSPTGKRMDSYYQFTWMTNAEQTIYEKFCTSCEDDEYYPLTKLSDEIYENCTDWKRKSFILKCVDAADDLRKESKNIFPRDPIFIDLMCNLVKHGKVDIIHFYHAQI